MKLFLFNLKAPVKSPVLAILFLPESQVAPMDSVMFLSLLQDIDETLAERLWGLTEMFPESVREFTHKLTVNTISGIKGKYSFFPPLSNF